MPRKWKRFLHQIALKGIRVLIRGFDEFELTELLAAVMRRYRVLHPDWELVCITAPVDAEKRKSELDQLVQKLMDDPR